MPETTEDLGDRSAEIEAKMAVAKAFLADLRYEEHPCTFAKAAADLVRLDGYDGKKFLDSLLGGHSVEEWQKKAVLKTQMARAQAYRRSIS